MIAFATKGSGNMVCNFGVSVKEENTIGLATSITVRAPLALVIGAKLFKASPASRLSGTIEPAQRHQTKLIRSNGRNNNRFLPGFMFRLTNEEFGDLMLQIARSKKLDLNES